MASSRARIASLLLLALPGCGIGVVGAAAEGVALDAPTDAATADGAVDGGATDAPAPVARCANLPANWGLVAVVSGDAACPAGFTAGQTDLFGGPSPRADACTCGCSVATQPSCVGTAGATYDNDDSNQCDSSSSYGWATITNGACGTDMWPGSYTTSHDWKFAAPKLQGGTCTSTAEKHPDRIDYATSRRACVPNAGCEGAPAITAPAQRCVLSDGDVPCPTSELTKRSVLAKSFDVTCTSACTCTVSGTCGAASVTLYSGAGCTGGSFSFAANGTCQSSTGTGTVASYRYNAPLSASSCTPGGTSSAGATPVGTMTLCCE